MLTVYAFYSFYIDQGYYESDCISLTNKSGRNGLIVNCGADGNITELIAYNSEYKDTNCKMILKEQYFVYSVTLTSGNIGRYFVILTDF